LILQAGETLRAAQHALTLPPGRQASLGYLDTAGLGIGGLAPINAGVFGREHK
jgi:hypothetical protein